MLGPRIATKITEIPLFNHCVAVLYPPVYDEDDKYSAEVRRVVASKSFEKIYDSKILCAPVTAGHPLLGTVPRKGKRMSFERDYNINHKSGVHHS
jgi:hypothetical protein